MRYLPVPACYYPTTVVFLDDDRNYLASLKRHLNVKQFSFQFLYDPLEALEFLRKYKVSSFVQRCITRPQENQYDHRIVDIDVGKIWQEAYHPNRFSEISVVVVDYAMPGLNGLDFASECRLLKKSPFKILLLTGEAGTDKAVTAFNDKIIDKFIRKDAPDFKEVLNAAICELQKEYFLDLSQMVIDSLTKDPKHPIVTWLDEPVFLKLFAEILAKNHAVEYYLADVLGSYMFLDDKGKPSWLAVKSDEEMCVAYEVVEGSATDFPEDIMQFMHDRKKILYLHGHKIGVSDNLGEVQKSLYPATELIGNKAKYYYAFIDNPNAYDIHSKKILSYKAYRDKLTGD